MALNASNKLLAVFYTMLKPLTDKQQTMANVSQFLHSLVTHLDTIFLYYASVMILNIHFDASHSLKKNDKSHASRHFYLG